MLAGLQQQPWLWGRQRTTALCPQQRHHMRHNVHSSAAHANTTSQRPLAASARSSAIGSALQQAQHSGHPAQRQERPTPPLLHPRRSRRCMHGVQPHATKDNKPSSSNDEQPSGRKSPPTRQGRPFGWLQRLATTLRLQGPLRLLLNVVMLFFLMRLWPMGGRTGLSDPESVVVQVPFSQFVRHVKHDDVQTVSMDGLHIGFSLKPGSFQVHNTPASSGKTQIAFSTVRPADYSVPYELLEKNGVTFSAVDKRGSGGFMQIMVYALYAVLLLSALNRLPIKLPQKGAGRKHRGHDAHSPVMFDDVAGVDEAKEELQEIVEFLRAPEKFSKLGARPPSGVLLVGPPGTGKTLLARAVAGEANCPFFSIAASEFVELYVGMGAMRVRELFASARKEAPAIVFIDEIDAVAKGRDMRLRSVGNDEREQTLNQLLTELDGFDTDKESVVICIAATNRPDVLDAALLRPGRFDRRVSVERPDRLGREQILKVHLGRRGLPLAADVSVDGVAAMTTGFTGADLANLVNEAALLAGRRSKAQVGREEFEAAILRAVAGIEKKRSILRGMEKDVVAKHEVGHALVSTAVARLIAGSPDVEKLSIIPRSGGALGFTYIPPKSEDRALMFDSEIRGQLAMLMGGRAAETLTCSAVSTGAVDDIRRATDLAYKAVSEFGLSAAIGPVNVGVLAAGGSDDMAWLGKGDSDVAKLVEAEVKAQLEAALTCAAHVVTANKGLHEGLSALLTKDERVEGEALAHWLEHVRVPESLEQFVVHGKLPQEKLHDQPATVAISKAVGTLPLEGAAVAGLPSPGSVVSGLLGEGEGGEGDRAAGGPAAAAGAAFAADATLCAGQQQQQQHWGV